MYGMMFNLMKRKLSNIIVKIVQLIEILYNICRRWVWTSNFSFIHFKK